MTSKNKPWAGRNQLRSLREQRRLTVEQLARFLEITKLTYYRLEDGADIRLTTAMRLARFYNIDVTELWEATR